MAAFESRLYRGREECAPQVIAQQLTLRRAAVGLVIVVRDLPEEHRRVRGVVLRVLHVEALGHALRAACTRPPPRTHAHAALVSVLGRWNIPRRRLRRGGTVSQQRARCTPPPPRTAPLTVVAARRVGLLGGAVALGVRGRAPATQRTHHLRSSSCPPPPSLMPRPTKWWAAVAAAGDRGRRQHQLTRRAAAGGRSSPSGTRRRPRSRAAWRRRSPWPGPPRTRPGGGGGGGGGGGCAEQPGVLQS
jgi:hypothetical protein